MNDDQKALLIRGLAGLIFGLGIILGYKEITKPREGKETDNVKVIEQKDYLTEFPMYHKSGMALISGDFDKDGDLDLIAGSYHPRKDKARLYFFENDGKGNFTLRPYTPK